MDKRKSIILIAMFFVVLVVVIVIFILKFKGLGIESIDQIFVNGNQTNGVNLPTPTYVDTTPTGNNVYMGTVYVRADSNEAADVFNFPVSNPNWNLKILSSYGDFLIVARNKVEPYSYLLLNRSDGMYILISTLTGQQTIVTKNNSMLVDEIKNNFYFYVSKSSFINGILLT